jgi:hypothetical protein
MSTPEDKLARNRRLIGVDGPGISMSNLVVLVHVLRVGESTTELDRMTGCML